MPKKSCLLFCLLGCFEGFGGPDRLLTHYTSAPSQVAQCVKSLSSTMAEGPTNRLYVGNIPWSTTVDELRGIFSGCGKNHPRGHPHRPPGPLPRLRHRRVLQRERGSGRHPDPRRCVNSSVHPRFQRRRRQSRCLRVDARRPSPPPSFRAMPFRDPRNCPGMIARAKRARDPAAAWKLRSKHPTRR